MGLVPVPLHPEFWVLCYHALLLGAWGLPSVSRNILCFHYHQQVHWGTKIIAVLHFFQTLLDPAPLKV